ncbi:MAG: amidohydrolase family protein [Anaerolineaceae bacterium]|nr:MAG: amidohydrolase family protein [Anaerolineaceae bacterium]
MKLLHNARIHTFDPARPSATALAVERGRVLAAGGEELLAEFGSAAREDMRGCALLPGLTDAHLHLQAYALSLTAIHCEVSTKEECLRRVAERAAAVKEGEWILGHGWNQNDWNGEWPCAADLEPAAPGRPVYLTAKSLHAAWASRAALRLAGITASTPDPADGVILRGRKGVPTGILIEQAMKLVEQAIPEPDPEALAETFQKEIIPGLWQMGLTGVHDFDRQTCFQALQLLHARGELHLRVLKSIPKELLPQAAELGLRTGFGDDTLRIGSVKLFADGALGPHTGAMFEPYVDDPQNRGMLILDGETLFELGRRAAESGLSLAVHAIGDRAVHAMLDGFERLRAYERERGLPALRHRIEHVQTIRPADASRLAGLGVIASMQPVHAPSDMDMTERYLGERSAFCYAWRTLLEGGARLAFGSDAPVETPNPFIGLHAAVTRRRADGAPGPEGWVPQQRLTVREAFEGFTIGPAFAAGAESRLGRLSPGFLADLIVLENDPFTCEPAALRELRPSATMLGGEWVWQM